MAAHYESRRASGRAVTIVHGEDAVGVEGDGVHHRLRGGSLRGPRLLGRRRRRITCQRPRCARERAACRAAGSPRSGAQAHRPVVQRVPFPTPCDPSCCLSGRSKAYSDAAILRTSSGEWRLTCSAATAAAAARSQIRLRAINGAGLACPVEQTLHIVGVLPVVVTSVLHRNGDMRVQRNCMIRCGSVGAAATFGQSSVVVCFCVALRAFTLFFLGPLTT